MKSLQDQAREKLMERNRNAWREPQQPAATIRRDDDNSEPQPKTQDEARERLMERNRDAWRSDSADDPTPPHIRRDVIRRDDPTLDRKGVR